MENQTDIFSFPIPASYCLSVSVLSFNLSSFPSVWHFLRLGQNVTFPPIKTFAKVGTRQVNQSRPRRSPDDSQLFFAAASTERPRLANVSVAGWSFPIHSLPRFVTYSRSSVLWKIDNSTQLGKSLSFEERRFQEKWDEKVHRAKLELASYRIFAVFTKYLPIALLKSYFLCWNA